jgi:hypothetical protein
MLTQRELVFVLDKDFQIGGMAMDLTQMNT